MQLEITLSTQKQCKLRDYDAFKVRQRQEIGLKPSNLGHAKPRDKADVGGRIVYESIIRTCQLRKERQRFALAKSPEVLLRRPLTQFLESDTDRTRPRCIVPELGTTVSSFAKQISRRR